MQPSPQLPKILRVMPEYGSSGIWVVKPTGPFRHCMIGYKALSLPSDLADRFNAWITDYWQNLDDPDHFNKPRFVAVGRGLACELKLFVGSEVQVVYASADDLQRDEEIPA